MSFFDFLKRKKLPLEKDLAQAEKLGLITKKEFLELKIKRAENELSDFLITENPKSKKK